MEKAPIFKPILGAVIGCIPGMIIWVIAGYFGFNIALIGLLIAAGIFFGYDKLGGYSATVQGVVTCIVIMLIMIYLGAHLVWSMQLKSALMSELNIDLSLGDCIIHLYDFMKSLDVTKDFIIQLFLYYLFAGIGAFGLIRRAIRR